MHHQHLKFAFELPKLVNLMPIALFPFHAPAFLDSANPAL